jgi:hypothetical protein
MLFGGLGLPCLVGGCAALVEGGRASADAPTVLGIGVVLLLIGGRMEKRRGDDWGG